MFEGKSGPHDRPEGERQEAHDEASASEQDSNSGHVKHTAQKNSSPGPQPPIHDKVQDSEEKPSSGPQPPAHEQEQHASVKEPPIAKRKARPARANGQHEKRERMKQEKRRLENERRLEGQRLEYERKLEARKKAEVVAATARAQSEGDERSTNGGKVPQRLSGSEDALRVRQRRQQQQPLMEESVKAGCKEDAERGSPMVAIKMDDDQKVHNDDDGAPGPRVLEHDTGATCLAITPDDEHSESHLIMMAHLASTMSLAPPSPPITPRDPFDPASSHSSSGYCFYGKDDMTCQCQYWCRCGLVREDLREDSQTGMESNYLFDPHLLRWPSPKPVESVQTRQDATDVLFQPSLERSGDSAGTAAAVTVVIPRVNTESYIRNNGVSTTGNTTHDFQRGRRGTGRGGYRGFRSRGRGGRGPRDEMS